MDQRLEQLENALGIDLSHLRTSARMASDVLDNVRTSATQYLIDQGILRPGPTPHDLELGMVAFGSLARQELSRDASDFDHAIVAYRPVERPEDIQQYRLAGMKAQLDVGLGTPGQTRLFGGVITASDMINRIGLEDDTNRSHTQRMLYLEESVSIIDAVSHERTLRSIIRRYLVDYRNNEPAEGLTKRGVPRFLLNDVVRYWRTVAVDYQAKRWDELSPPVGSFSAGDQDKLGLPKWGTRYLKLRSTRKLAFVGTLVALLLPRITDDLVSEEFLYRQFKQPPLARLGQLNDYIDDAPRAHLRRVFSLADRFAALFGDPDFRRKANEVEHPRAEGANAAFSEARELSMQLELALERLFLSYEPLHVPGSNRVPSPIHGFDPPLSLAQLTARYMLF